MNRTAALPDNWFLYKSEKPRAKAGALLKKPVMLPVKDTSAFTLCRKFICPKQINDTVSVFFEGDFTEIKVFASKKQLSPEKDENGRTVFDVTSALKRGSTVISAVCNGGSVDAFYFRVKRKE